MNINITQILILTFALLLDLTVTAARSGLLSIRYAKLESLRENQDPKVKKVFELISKRTHLRATFKLVQTSLRFIIAGAVLSGFMPENIPANSGVLITLMLVIAGMLIWITELAVERVILKDSDRWAFRLSSFAKLLMTIFSPVVMISLKLTRQTESNPAQAAITEEELKSLVDASERAGQIEEDESKMIHDVLELADTSAREVMVPRVDMLTIDINISVEEAADIMLNSGYSRVPLFEDQVENIIGLLYTKDLLKAWRNTNGAHSLRELRRDAKFIPETKKLDELIDEMQADHLHIAIIVDEYGGISGLVTLEDIVEEIFGEIKDEYDEGEEELYEQIDENEYLLHGRITLNDMNKLLDSELESEDADTLSGWIYNHLGRVPEINETLQQDSILLTVEKLSGRRIKLVRAQKKPAPTENTQ